MPYRIAGTAADAPISVLLVTSRETKRWVIPKGNAKRNLPPHASAAIEAEEEAGVRGLMPQTPIGSFRYRKRLHGGASVMQDVDVFPLAVTQELTKWKERRERERRWFSPAEAADAVEESDLAEIIRSFDPSAIDMASNRSGAEEPRGGWRFASSARKVLRFLTGRR